MSEQKHKKEHRRFLAKIRSSEGQYGQFQKVLVENPSPYDKNGKPDKYYKGNLIWCDEQTGKQFIVKQLGFAGVAEGAKAHGFISSLYIDLDDSYSVEEIEE